MKPSKKYKPISCVFYDHIEHFAMRKEEVLLVYLHESEKVELKTKILDTKSENKIEYILVGTTNQWLRMDRIISINEHVLADHNAC